MLWRLLGIQLHIYTALKVYASLDVALENQMAYSTGSIFFFGIARHVYNYIKLKQVSTTAADRKTRSRIELSQVANQPTFFI